MQPTVAVAQSLAGSRSEHVSKNSHSPRLKSKAAQLQSQAATSSHLHRQSAPSLATIVSTLSRVPEHFSPKEHSLDYDMFGIIITQ